MSAVEWIVVLATTLNLTLDLILYLGTRRYLRRANEIREETKELLALVKKLNTDSASILLASGKAPDLKRPN